jgi:hypothetical protein
MYTLAFLSVTTIQQLPLEINYKITTALWYTSPMVLTIDHYEVHRLVPKGLCVRRLLRLFCMPREGDCRRVG